MDDITPDEVNEYKTAIRNAPAFYKQRSKLAPRTAKDYSPSPNGAVLTDIQARQLQSIIARGIEQVFWRLCARLLTVVGALFALGGLVALSQRGGAVSGFAVYALVGGGICVILGMVLYSAMDN